MSAALAGLEGADGRRPAIVILDFGSQYSELIARRVRETEVYSLVVSHTTTLEQLKALGPRGIILSGGPSSVYAAGAPLCDPGIWDLGIPVLGVCYGMQLMVQQLGGSVEASERGEYGKAPLFVDDPTDLLTNVDDGSTMWMSHGDSVQALPDGFTRLAHTDNTPEAAIAHHGRKLYGVQFHPEVVHSTCGMALIRNFIYHICGCEPDWTTSAFIDEAVADGLWQSIPVPQTVAQFLVVAAGDAQILQERRDEYERAARCGRDAPLGELTNGLLERQVQVH